MLNALEPGTVLPIHRHRTTAEKGRWHRLEALETGTVIVEFKNCPYEPIGAEDVMEG